MTSPSRTFGLLAALLAAMAFVGWLVWQPGAGSTTSRVALLDVASTEPAPSPADLRGSASLNGEPMIFEVGPSERTSIDITSTPVDPAPAPEGLHGIVIDMQGQPVAGAVVAMLYSSAVPFDEMSPKGVTVWKTRGTSMHVASKAETDLSGRFAFSSTVITPHQTIELAIDKEDYLFVSSFPVEDARQEIKIQIATGASITLPVIAWPAIEREGSAAVRIAYQTSPDRFTNRTIQTYALTEFREKHEQAFTGLPADTYVVEVLVGPGRWTAFSQTVTVQDGEHRQLDPVEIGEGFVAYDLQIVDQHQRPIRYEKLRVDYVNTGLTAFGVPITDADGITFFVLPNNLGPLRMKSYNNGAANLSPSFGARVSKEGGSRVLTFMLTL